MENNLTINDYLDNLEVDKQTLNTSLKKINSEVTEEDTFTQSISKLGNIKDTIMQNSFETDPVKIEAIRKKVSYSETPLILYVKELPDEITLPIPSEGFSGPTLGLSYFQGTKAPKILNLPECKSGYGFFAYCEHITEFKDIDLINVTDAREMFLSCDSLEKVTNLSIPKAVLLDLFYCGCGKLKEVEALNVPLATSFKRFCDADSALTKVNRITSNQPIITLEQAFSGCRELQYLDLGGLIITANTNLKWMLSGNVPKNCTIIVKNDEAYNALHAKYPDYTFTIKDLESIQLDTISRINLAYNTTTKVNVIYEGGPTEQRGVTFTVDGPATIDTEGNLTMSADAQEGDTVTITATSNYNTSITATASFTVANREKDIVLNLNDGQFVETEELVNENKVYQSDAGSYHINNGKSIASMAIIGYTKFVVYIKSDAEGYSDYMEIYDLGVTPSRDKGILSTRGKQNQWLKKEFSITDKTVTQSISVMYSKDGSVDSGTDRGYFYIAESECE